eukprot:TRINITY_DN7060_c0_g2_i1.p2 TRINITY_DN7060_c0_g2~~TRINITY_DN7060_c0_g2_i1.p2  ORF type:complete len:104 (-),score=12.96 TRINITY_DN7060_c0_g2_i1:55-366(-)
MQFPHFVLSLLLKTCALFLFANTNILNSFVSKWMVDYSQFELFDVLASHCPDRESPQFVSKENLQGTTRELITPSHNNTHIPDLGCGSLIESCNSVEFGISLC